MLFLQNIARTLISLQSLYVAGERWVAPANVPHLVIRTTFPAEDRLHFRCSIPELYAPSAPYLHIFEGLLVELPSMLGLPRGEDREEQRSRRACSRWCSPCRFVTLRVRAAPARGASDALPA